MVGQYIQFQGYEARITSVDKARGVASAIFVEGPNKGKSFEIFIN